MRKAYHVVHFDDMWTENLLMQKANQEITTNDNWMK